MSKFDVGVGDVFPVEAGTEARPRPACPPDRSYARFHRHRRGTLGFLTRLGVLALLVGGFVLLFNAYGGWGLAAGGAGLVVIAQMLRLLRRSPEGAR